MIAGTLREKDLSARWKTASGEQLAQEVFSRLLARKPLSYLPLGEHDGRADLRGIVAPAHEQLRVFEQKGWVVQELGGLLKFEGARFTNVDMSGGRLESLRFFHTEITNCQLPLRWRAVPGLADVGRRRNRDDVRWSRSTDGGTWGLARRKRQRLPPGELLECQPVFYRLSSRDLCGV